MCEPPKPSKEAVDSTVMDEDEPSPDEASPSVELPPEGESPAQWVVRVVSKSYRDGGIGMILKRLAKRIAGQKD